jgi:hypothetical protein
MHSARVAGSTWKEASGAAPSALALSTGPRTAAASRFTDRCVIQAAVRGSYCRYFTRGRCRPLQALTAAAASTKKIFVRVRGARAQFPRSHQSPKSPTPTQKKMRSACLLRTPHLRTDPHFLLSPPALWGGKTSSTNHPPLAARSRPPPSPLVWSHWVAPQHSSSAMVRRPLSRRRRSSPQ